MEQARRPVAGDIYRHFKDRLYEIITIAIHSETEEEMVVYRQLYGDFQTYVRPLSMFLSEVDHEKYPDAAQKYRFELVREEKKEEVNAVLMEFLDAETCRDKLKVLEKAKDKIDGRILNNMAISVDIAMEEGTLDSQIEELMECLRMKARFECVRLR